MGGGESTTEKTQRLDKFMHRKWNTVGKQDSLWELMQCQLCAFQSHQQNGGGDADLYVSQSKQPAYYLTIETIDNFFVTHQLSVPSRVLKSHIEIQSGSPSPQVSGRISNNDWRQQWSPSPNKLNFDNFSQTPKLQPSPSGNISRHINLVSPSMMKNKKQAQISKSQAIQLKPSEPLIPKGQSPVDAGSQKALSSSHIVLKGKGKSEEQIATGSNEREPRNEENSISDYADLKRNPNINPAESIYEKSPNRSFLLNEKLHQPIEMTNGRITNQSDRIYYSSEKKPPVQENSIKESYKSGRVAKETQGEINRSEMVNQL